MAFQQNLDEARKNLPRVLKVLTELSLQSTATLLPQDERADSMLADYEKRLDNMSSMIQLDEDRLNPKWNKVYGEDGTNWDGPLDDGRARGGIPYFCPKGWVRFSLGVCADDMFEQQFGSWGYLYHGTNSKHIGSILMSGFRASQGLCYCGIDDSAVYMSPSIEYCGHPRYGCIEYNPETRKWLQMVLQCRVNPQAVWKKGPETMGCEQFKIATIDPNISNNNMEWLFRPEHVVAGEHYVKDAIVCTGIMLRITDTNPCEMPYWWSKDPGYLAACCIDFPVVDPVKPLPGQWIDMSETEMEVFSFAGSCLGKDFQLEGTKRQLGASLMAPRPFAKGGMRFAYYLQTQGGMYVVKKYNRETLNYITDVLNISQEEAIHKEVSAYLVAEHYAAQFNTSMPARYRSKTNYIHFLVPCVFRLTQQDGTKHLLFGEKHVEGNFIKWNSNAGYVNTGSEAEAAMMDQMVGVFAHHTFHASKGHLMVVDIQGWQLGGEADRNILFTDPQIHTRFPRSKSRFNDPMYRRFSLGNLGRTGMVRFFKTHQCTVYCREMGMPSQSATMDALRTPNIGKRGSVLFRREDTDSEGSDDDLPEHQLALARTVLPGKRRPVQPTALGQALPGGCQVQ